MNKSLFSFIAILLTVIACSSHKSRNDAFLKRLISGKMAMIPTLKSHEYRNEADSEGKEIYDVFLD